MKPRRSAADEGLLYSAERWTPAEAELWGRWRESLRAEQRADALLPLQAVLSGLAAFRHPENHPQSTTVIDFRPHLHTVGVAYRWALELVARLRCDHAPEAPPRGESEPFAEPEASLRALERSLSNACRVSERLVELPVVDESAFQSSCDLFARDLERNAFFQPPDPLEFSNVAELVRPEGLTPEVESWKSPAAQMTTLIAFLTLLRGHRFLGIADAQIGDETGLYRAHVVVAAVRKELRTLTRFLLVQGVETLADELEARLLSLDADSIAQARNEITSASGELKELRESVEALAVEIHSRVRTDLDEPLPTLSTEHGLALPAERLRNGIRELRDTVKGAAKELHGLGRPLEGRPPTGESERVAKHHHQDLWAFRFILRAFVAKASVATVDADHWSDHGSLEFVAEFVRHFRVFGPRLTRATGYPRRGPLTRAVSPLGRQQATDVANLDLAAHECGLFLEHLEEALAEVRPSMLAPFDKNKAAAELRGYLAAAKDRSVSDRAAAGAFGLTA
jgi:hypothetical protein